MSCKKVYSPVSGQPAATIIEDETHRFVSDAQITTWTDGVYARAVFSAMAFRRASLTPDTPTGGDFDFPIPDGGLWTNSPLPGEDPVWVTTRIFSNDGLAPQDAEWSPPRLFVRHGFDGVSGLKGDQGDRGSVGPQGNPGVDGADGVHGNDGVSISWLAGDVNDPNHPINATNGNAYYNEYYKKSFIYWDGSWYQMTIDGLDGLAGLQQVLVTLFQKSTDQINPPATFSGVFTYTFATAELTGGTLNGWSQTIPSITAGECIWVRQATASSDQPTDTIDATEFSAGVVLSSAGLDGLNSTTVNLYQKSFDGVTAPPAPTGTFTYTFSTALLSGGDLGWWTQTIPSIGLGEYVWLIQATATSNTDTDSIEATEFSSAIVYTASGNDGAPGSPGIPIIWKGETNDPLAAYGSPELNWVYRDTDNLKVYIYNGSAWELMVLDGNDGPEGNSVFITYNDSAADEAPPIPPTNADGTDNNWHTDPTADVNWMSQKIGDETTTNWGAAILIKGAGVTAEQLANINNATAFIANITDDNVYSIIEKAGTKTPWEEQVQAFSSVAQTATDLNLTSSLEYTNFVATATTVLTIMETIWDVPPYDLVIDYTNMDQSTTLGVATPLTDGSETAYTRTNINDAWNNYWTAKAVLENKINAKLQGQIDDLSDSTLELVTNTSEIVTDLPAIDFSVANFNNRNDRISVTPADPVIANDGTAIDFSFSPAGNVIVNFAWSYDGSGDAYNIDGFVIYGAASSSPVGADFTTETQVNYKIVEFDKREAVFNDVPAEMYYTIGIQAYRVVDTDINSLGVLKSNVIQPTFTDENPIFVTRTVPAPTNINAVLS